MRKKDFFEGNYEFILSKIVDNYMNWYSYSNHAEENDAFEIICILEELRGFINEGRNYDEVIDVLSYLADLLDDKIEYSLNGYIEEPLELLFILLSEVAIKDYSYINQVIKIMLKHKNEYLSNMSGNIEYLINKIINSLTPDDIDKYLDSDLINKLSEIEIEL